MCTEVPPGRYAVVETMASGLRAIRHLRITTDAFYWLRQDGKKQTKNVQWDVQSAHEQVEADPARCAIRFSKRTGKCFRCAKPLEAQPSLDRACGEWCWRKIREEWSEGSVAELVSLYEHWTEDDLSTQEAA